MRFPIIIHQENNCAFGIIMPYMPGCFSSGDTLGDALKNVHEAIDIHMAEVVSSHGGVPAPSAMSKVVSNPEYKEGAVFYRN
ncbi:type II toxin-antitoxin system HicB family antitoxin [Cernens ardua]|uniref:type II toxin-antitoxin system HicB family antitoxin n=1 Tax=Cernens ardua TaxID=3402176 RepID=UPI003F985B8F